MTARSPAAVSDTGPRVDGAPARNPALPKDLAANPRLDRWVSVHDDGTVEVRVGKVEFGQGILTALAQVAAEELDLPLDRVRMPGASTATGPDEGLTAGSMSIIEAAPAVRLVCAQVRALFAAEASRRWRTDLATIEVAGGEFRGPAGASATYAELAGSVDLAVDADPATPVKDPAGYRLVGTSAARLDLPGKVAGLPRFIADLRLPGQLFGRVVRPPSPGAQLTAVDASAVGEGVRVVRDGSFLGVIGPDEAEVGAAADALRRVARWAETDTLPDEDDLAGHLRRAPAEATTVVDDGPAPRATGPILGARYTRPYLAHASIAPSCGVARWELDGTLSVWSSSQGIHRLRDAIAQALGLGADAVVVQHVENAGCYGHNGADDAAFDAVLLARAVPGRPVQARWSRADELGWAPFGSAMAVEVTAQLDGAGRIASWRYDVWSQGHTARPGYAGVPGLLAGASLEQPRPAPPASDPPQAAGGGTSRNAVPLYDVGNRCVRGHRVLDNAVRSSALRALGAHMNVFSIESFLDELAWAAGADPLEFRLRHLDDERARAVLTTAATAAGWGGALDDGLGRGIGLARYKGRGAYCAVVAEVEAVHDIRVRRLTVAVDVGRIVNPEGVRMQIEGGAVQATSWTTKERVRFDRRRITSDDWESYPILRFTEVPEIDVRLVDRPDLPSVGAGEAAQGPTAGAIANAVAAAVGVRVRDLPLTTEAVTAVINR
ncbi:MAG TPA: molybdopterin cofactor-binding domain-containing protein [Blastococcus sp.]|nr:molybdopterin cofactor-binding domain-containing protein [Blastococcus sp.]